MKRVLNKPLLANIKNCFFSLKIFCIILSLCVANVTWSDELCDLVFDGCPEDFNGDTIIVPEEIVALSKNVHTCEADKVLEEIVDSGGPSSIVFIIDHSYSMMGLGNAHPGNDEYGARFRVVKDLLDTIYATNPNTEIGLVVFREVLYFDHTNNDLFVQLPSTNQSIFPFLGPRNTDQSYLPLIKLNSTLSNGKQGINVVKELLETDTITEFNRQYRVDVECVDLKYKPNFETVGNTNINSAFDAAKEALKSSSYAKTNRFIVFLSDGEPYPLVSREQGGKTPFYFVDGNNTPTTFTIFFNNKNIAPQSLINMTKNISQNGYSQSNPSSEIWTIQADYQNLMKLLKENVYSNILHIIKFHPGKISVNGKTSTKYSNSAFHFENRFPFIKGTNSFDIDITYMVEDKTSDNDEGRTTKNKFYFKRKPNVDMPKGFKKECWDRSLGFYFNKREISSANETMDELEIRFNFDPGKAGYYYKKVTVDIMTEENGTNDRETFTLNKKSSGFSKSFKRIIKTSSSKNGVLEHLENDSIIALFRNPDIPLDTLRVSIPFDISKIISVKTGTYFDTNADGFIDSIFIKTEGKIQSKDLPEFMEALTLPSSRKFSIQDKFVSKNGNGVGILVDEDKSSIPRTNITEDDKFTIDPKSFSHGGILLEHSSQFIDSVAPVIINANLIKYLGSHDTLEIVFSEPVKDVRKINPFYFRNPASGIQYIADVKQYYLQESTNSVHFHIDKIEGINDQTIEEMNENDSIWIKTENLNNVVDLVKNNQGNPDNVRTLLSVQLKYMPYGFDIHSTAPYDIKNMQSIPEYISSIPEISSFILKKNFVRRNGLFQGMIIMVKPDNPLLVSKEDRFTAVLSIFDHVSNTIIQKEPMGFYDGDGDIKNCALFFIWDGTNKNNRYVSSGAYVAIAEITRLNTSGKVIYVTNKRTYLGVKE